MTANVESLMWSGTTPWHGLGKQVEGEKNAEQAIKLAGLDWDVEVAPIVSDDQKRTGVDRYRMTRRVTDDAVLGIVKKGWKPIQNREAFRLFDKVVGEGKAIYHTAGALDGGSKVFIQAKLPEPVLVGPKKDPIDRYLLLSNAHDGTRPLQMLFTPVRVVCSNTLGMALFKNGKKTDEDEKLRFSPRVAISHRLALFDKERAKKECERIMKAAYNWYTMFGDFAQYASSKQLNGNQVKTIVSEVFPANKRKEVTPAIVGHRSEVERLFVEGQGHEDIAGSAWALVNAFAEYADHRWALRNAKEPGDRSYSIWMGGARGLKNRANKVVSEAIL